MPYVFRVLPLFAALVLAGCSITPSLTVQPPRELVRGVRLAVVLTDDSVEVKHLERLRRDVPIGADTTYEELFWATLMPALRTQTAFAEVVRAGLTAGTAWTGIRVQVEGRQRRAIPQQATVLLPPVGQPLEGVEADYVLFLQDVRVDRTEPSWGPQSLMGGGGVVPGPSLEGDNAVAVTARAVLWDNRAGQPVMAGRLSSAEGGHSRGFLGLGGEEFSRATWDGAVAGFVEEVVDELRLARAAE